jgi:hypothetical protein
MLRASTGTVYARGQFFVVAGLTSAVVELSIIYGVLGFEQRKYHRRWKKQLAYLKDRLGGGPRQADFDWLDMVPTNEGYVWPAAGLMDTGLS